MIYLLVTHGRPMSSFMANPCSAGMSVEKPASCSSLHLSSFVSACTSSRSCKLLAAVLTIPLTTLRCCDCQWIILELALSGDTTPFGMTMRLRDCGNSTMTTASYVSSTAYSPAIRQHNHSAHGCLCQEPPDKVCCYLSLLLPFSVQQSVVLTLAQTTHQQCVVAALRKTLCNHLKCVVVACYRAHYCCTSQGSVQTKSPVRSAQALEAPEWSSQEVCIAHATWACTRLCCANVAR